MTHASTLKGQLRDLLDQWDRADRAVYRHRTNGEHGDANEAEEARRSLEAQLYVFQLQLAELFNLLLRTAIEFNPGTLRRQLLDLIAPDVGRLVRRILRERNGR